MAGGDRRLFSVSAVRLQDAAAVRYRGRRPHGGDNGPDGLVRIFFFRVFHGGQRGGVLSVPALVADVLFPEAHPHGRGISLLRSFVYRRRGGPGILEQIHRSRILCRLVPLFPLSRRQKQAVEGDRRQCRIYPFRRRHRNPALPDLFFGKRRGSGLAAGLSEK